MLRAPGNVRSGRSHSHFGEKVARWRVLEIHTKAEHLLPQVGIQCGRLMASYLLLTIGSLLCASVTSTYIWMYIQQERLLAQWDRNSAVDAKPLTKISIPKIRLEAVVLEGASQHSLLAGPARLIESALPGEHGNLVIAGHRDTFFRHVHSLRYGDDIYVMRGGQTFRYKVIARKVVEPSDVSVLRPSLEGHLTLITCFPTNAIGPAPQRLIVIARLAGERLVASSRK